MSWGPGDWGTEPWGSVQPTAVDVPAPVILGLQGSIACVRGGTVLTIFGDGFYLPVVVELEQAAQVIGTCFIWDPEFDVRMTVIYAGTPALPVGTYDMRITTDSGTAFLESAVEVRVFAEEMKSERSRRSFAPVWNVSARIAGP